MKPACSIKKPCSRQKKNISLSFANISHSFDQLSYITIILNTSHIPTMRSSAIISSSLLAIVVSGAPVDLPKLAVGLPSLDLPSLPAKVPTEFPATIPSGLSTNDVTLPVENLPARRADASIVGDVLEDDTLIDGIDPTVHLPVPVKTLPVNTGMMKKAVDVNVPVTVTIDDLVEAPEVEAPTVAVPTAPEVGVPPIPAIPVAGLASRDIEQSLPVVGGAKIPFNAGDIQIGTVDKYADELVRGVKIENLPKVVREIEQSLPVLGSAKVPIDAGEIQVGTVDKDVVEVAEGVALNDVPVLDVVKDTTVKDLPNLGLRGIEQSLPVVGNVAVPLNAGEIQVGTVDKYLGEVVEGTTTGL